MREFFKKMRTQDPEQEETFRKVLYSGKGGFKRQEKYDGPGQQDEKAEEAKKYGGRPRTKKRAWQYRVQVQHLTRRYAFPLWLLRSRLSPGDAPSSGGGRVTRSLADRTKPNT
eukprot:scaffold1245_cov252-Pinguiococcus_pyrenoidosus.AAC.12